MGEGRAGSLLCPKGALVKLSDVMTKGKRTHLIIRMFKKYGTQSAIRTFKNNQVKEWGFTIEVNKYKEQDGKLPLCREGESWTAHNIEGYLDETTKNMMCRNGSYEFLVRHNNAPCGVGSVFTSDVWETVQRALSRGCPQYEVVNRLETVTNEFKGIPAFDTSVPVGRGAPMALGGTAFMGAMAVSPGGTDSFTREGVVC